MKRTTGLKDWAEVLLTKKQFKEAEAKIRAALELLEELDSDALFTLGLILSEQGRDEESIEAYEKSIALNSEDAELCYNLGIKLGARGYAAKELELYGRATKIDPTFGGAWINWGTSLAESGDLDGAEVKFKNALIYCPSLAVKALMNLSLVNQARANQYAVGGDLTAAKKNAEEASNQLDYAKTLIDKMTEQERQDEDMISNVMQFKALRLQCHKLMGQVLAGSGDFEACEGEFRTATENFQDSVGAWEMLYRVLVRLGKTDEAVKIKEKIDVLRALGVAY